MRAHDRDRKLPIYERQGVRWSWLVDPGERTLGVYTRGEGGRWGEPRLYQGAARVRAVPFEAVELDLALLWAR